MPGASPRLVVAIGELVVDWISTLKGGGFIESDNFVKSLGGNASNVAIALARLGGSARVLARVGNDIHGRYLLNVLEAEGVDTSLVLIDDNAPTAQCYVFTTLDEDNTFLNWPPGNAATRLTAGDITDDHLECACAIHATGISLIQEPRRQAIVSALSRARQLGLLVSFDAGFPTGEGNAALAAFEKVLSCAHIVKVNLLELFFWARHFGKAVDESDLEFISTYEKPPSTGQESKVTVARPNFSLDRIKELSAYLYAAFEPEALLVTMAQHGSYVLGRKHDSWASAYKVDTVSGVGAGDAYVAGFLHALLAACPQDGNPVATLENISMETLSQCNDFAGAVGAICTTHVSAYQGLPGLSAVMDLTAKSIRA